MIKLDIRRRRTGKTTEIIRRMNEDENIILIAPNFRMKKNLYPPELHKRILTALDKNLVGEILYHREKKFLMDEGFLLSPDRAALFFYDMGRYGIDIEIYGSLY